MPKAQCAQERGLFCMLRAKFFLAHNFAAFMGGGGGETRISRTIWQQALQEQIFLLIWWLDSHVLTKAIQRGYLGPVPKPRSLTLSAASLFFGRITSMVACGQC